MRALLLLLLTPAAFAQRLAAPGITSPILHVDLPSIEWLTVDAEFIVIATVTEHAFLLDPVTFGPAERLTLRVLRTVKSPSVTPAPDRLVVTAHSRNPVAMPFLGRERAEFVVFLSRNWTRLNATGDLEVPDLDTHIVRLPGPLDSERDPGARVVSELFNLLDTREEILAAIDACLASPPTRGDPVPGFDVDVSWLLNWGFSFEFDPRPSLVRVPNDDRWRLEYIRRMMQRQFLPDIQNQYPPAPVILSAAHHRPTTDALNSPAAIDALKPYLRDPDFTLRHAPAWPESIPLVRQKFYYRRAFAADLLASMHVPFDATVVEPAYPRRPFSRHLFWLLALPLLLPLLLARRTTPVTRRLRRAVLAANLVLALTCAAFTVRSRHHYDEVLLGTATAEYELSSCFNRLQILYLADRPTPYGPLVFTIPQHGQELPDHLGRLGALTDVERLGLNYQTGIRTSPRRDPYRLLRIPWWMLTALVSLSLLLSAFRQLKTTLRRRHRLRHNRCPACAYDLRATPSQCPECGWSHAPSDAPARNPLSRR